MERPRQERAQLGVVALRIDLLAHRDEQAAAVLHEVSQLGRLRSERADVQQEDHVEIGEARLPERLRVDDGGTYRGCPESSAPPR